MSLRRILAMMRKEVIQIWRDPRSLLIIFAMPLVQLVIYGYGVNLDIKHIPLCVYDRDATQTSQDLLKHFQATDYFTIVHVAEDYRDVVQQIDQGACTVAVVVPPQFSEDLHSSGQAPVQALLDASDSNTASIGMGYALSIVQAYSQDVQIEWQQRHGLPPVTPNVTFQPRTWFNEDLESMANIVPGVVAMVMAVVGAFLTSLTIAREWERGTMEQLIATPVRKLEIQIGKLIPYFVIGMMDTALCAGAAVWWFGVPFRGKLDGAVCLLGAVPDCGAVRWGIFSRSRPSRSLGPASWLCWRRCCRRFFFPVSSSPSTRCPCSCSGSRASCRRDITFPFCAVFFSRARRCGLWQATSWPWGFIAVVLIITATRAFQKRLE